MKNKIIIIATISLFLFNSCNNDVFVDEMNASTTNLQMSGEGDSTVVGFSTSDWHILSVYYGDEYYKDVFYGKLYDVNGNIINNDDVPFYDFKIDKGYIIHSGTQEGFTISRTQDKCLNIKLDENLTGKDFMFTILIGNSFKTIPINVIQKASSGYTLDHITYKYKPQSYCKKEEWTVDTINNISKSALTIEYSVFSEERQVSSFVSTDKKAFSYLNYNQLVDIPIGIKDSILQFSNKKMYYNPHEQRKSLNFDDVYKTIVLPVGKSQILKSIEYEYFNAEYTLYIRKNDTNKIKCVSGIFKSRIPSNSNYYIILNHKLLK
ncbi:MAG TPA: hypothetical protein PLF38_02455 [Xylanibacter oryzae]|nr:hypothetical protein [Xylanibacter oryzae]